MQNTFCNLLDPLQSYTVSLFNCQRMVRRLYLDIWTFSNGARVDIGFQ